MSLINFNFNCDFRSLINETKGFFRKEDDNILALNALNAIFADFNYGTLELIDTLISTNNQWDTEYSKKYLYDVVWLEKKKIPYNGTEEKLFQIRDIFTNDYQLHKYLKNIRINPLLFPFIKETWNNFQRQRIYPQGGDMNA